MPMNPMVTMTAKAEEDLKKKNLAMNNLIVYLKGQPLRVVTSTLLQNPYNAWNALVAMYEPSTIEAYLQLLREMEKCIMEDPYKSLKGWFYKLNSISRSLSQVNVAYAKSDLHMIVNIVSKIPKDLY